jgi:hypothetical protein
LRSNFGTEAIPNNIEDINTKAMMTMDQAECRRLIDAIPAETRTKLELMYSMEHETRTDHGLEPSLDDYLWHQYRDHEKGYSLQSEVSECTGLSLSFRLALREALGLKEST